MLGLLGRLLLFPVTGPLQGIRFITQQIAEELDAQLLDERRIQGELMTITLHHDMGQISDAEFEAEETILLERLDAIRAYKEALLQSQGYFPGPDDYEYEYVDDYIEEDTP